MLKERFHSFIKETVVKVIKIHKKTTCNTLFAIVNTLSKMLTWNNIESYFLLMKILFEEFKKKLEDNKILLLTVPYRTW